MIHKLGLKPLVHPVRLHLRNYVNLSVLPTPPAKVDWSLGMTSEWSMLGNGPDPDNPPAMPPSGFDINQLMFDEGLL